MPLNEPDFKLKPQLTKDKLKYKVAELARLSRDSSGSGKGLSVSIIKRYAKNAYKYILSKQNLSQECFEFEYWLYENFYEINKKVNKIKREVSKFSFLPHYKDLPRIYLFAELIVKSCDGYLTADIIDYCIKAFNDESPLEYNEILALKSAIEYAILEYIAIFASRSIKIGGLVESAKNDSKKSKIDLVNLRYNSYIYALYKYSNEQSKKSIMRLCLDNGLAVNDRVDNFNVMTARYNAQMQSCFSTLLKLDDILTDEFIIKLSPIDDMFNLYSKNAYENCTLNTKYLYLFNVYKGAKKKKISETAFARNVIDSSDRDNKDISFYILKAPKTKKFMVLYICTFILLTALLAYGYSFTIDKLKIAFILLSIPIFFTISGIILKFILTSLSQRREMPSIDLNKQNDFSKKCLIAMPVLVKDITDIDNVFKNLLTNLCANRESVFSYCLLVDFMKSETKDFSDNEKEMIEKLKDYVQQSEFKKRITILIRNRTKILGRKEEVYQGWEKKRGALIDLNSLILKGETNNFDNIIGEIPNSIDYIVTLDSDTLTNNCYELVQIMEHPYNRSVNIISINVQTSAESSKETIFSRLFSGGVGISSYSNYTSDIEYDIFGQGSYTGKGIYRVKEFQEKLENTFKDNRILSHDYIEGSYAVCANSSYSGVETFPSTLSAFLLRNLRWLRGDWQLMPYLFFRIKDRQNHKQKNPLTIISKWHIFCNMIYSLVPCVSFAILVLSMVLGSVMSGIILSFVLNIIYVLLSVRKSFNTKSKNILYELSRQFINALFLPVIAFNYFCAICITISRLVTKKDLLEWDIFAHANKRISIIPNVIASIILVASTAVYQLNIVFYIIAAFFLSGICVDFIISKTRHKKKVISKDFEDLLKNIFNSTYKFFTNEQNHSKVGLVNGAYQSANNVGWVKITTPSDLGFTILSHVSAYEMGLINYTEFIENVEPLINIIQKLPKFKGILYDKINIYDIKNNNYKYLSAIENGNLLIALCVLLTYTKNQNQLDVLKLIDDMQIEFLFDYNKGLYRTGYNVNTGAMDASWHDLLGSESSVFYLVSVALNRINKNYFNNLSKNSVKYNTTATLYSYGGGMIEQLFTSQFFNYHDGTVVYNSAKNLIKMHIRYSKENNFKLWGMSDSAYLKFDKDNLYMMQSFGLEKVAVKNEFYGNVVSPYSSIISLSFESKKVQENLNNYIRIGMSNGFGLYDSYDLDNSKAVKYYDAKHQGLVLIAICNFLNSNVIIKSLEKLPQIRSANLLLEDSCFMPVERKIVYNRAINDTNKENDINYDTHTNTNVNLLSSNRISLLNKNDGNGYLMYGDVFLNKRDSRDCGVVIKAKIADVSYNLQKGEFKANVDSTIYNVVDDKFTSNVNVMLLPNGVGEVRIVEFNNITEKSIDVIFSSFFEIGLNKVENDFYNFNKDFIMDFDYENNVVIASKIIDKKNLYLTHYINDINGVKYFTEKVDYEKWQLKEDVNLKPIKPIICPIFNISVPAKTKIVFEVYTLCATSLDAIKNNILLTKVEGFSERVKGNSSALMLNAGYSSEVKALAEKILFSSASSVMDKKVLSANINYKRPIIVFEFNGENSKIRLQKRLKQLILLYKFGIEFNLVIIYSEKHSYYMQFLEMINNCLDELLYYRELNLGSRVVLVNETQEKDLVRAIRDCQLDFKNSMSDIVIKNNSNSNRIKAKVYPNTIMVPLEIVDFQGFGGYLNDSSYVIDLSNSDTPMAWSNVIANKEFGTVVTESGCGFTFKGDCQKNKLTVNKESSDKNASEFVLLSENGVVWSITKNPIVTKSNYHVVHGFGYTEFRNNYNGFYSTQKIYINQNENIKYYDITLKNETSIDRIVDFAFCTNPVLGDLKKNTKHALKIDKASDRVEVVNTLNDSYFYIHCSQNIDKITKHKKSFCDDNNNYSFNQSNQGSESLFIASYSKLKIKANSVASIVFSIGCEEDVEFDNCDAVLRFSKKYYSTLSDISIKNVSYLTHSSKWLAYQSLSSSFFARGSFYNTIGQTKFKNQLLDCLALLYIDPILVRNHILECTSKQFESGEVVSGWTSKQIYGKSISIEDRLFLPYLTYKYITYTKDYEFIAERIPYLESDGDYLSNLNNAKIQQNNFRYTKKTYPLLEHCLKAIKSCINFDSNGFAKVNLKYDNDINDTNKNNFESSVQNSMFLYYVIKKFLVFVNDIKEKNLLISLCERLQISIDDAWDSEWYISGYDKNDKKVGSLTNDECRLDLNTQAWSILSGACPKDKTSLAMSSAENILVDYENKIVKSFAPPFKSDDDIPKIFNYSLNGCHQTESIAYYIKSLIKCGKIESAWKIFVNTLPLSHTNDINAINKYVLEPYVLSNSIYTNSNLGRGDFSWNTSASSLLYVCLVEGFLGIKREGKKLFINPNLPKEIDKLSFDYRTEFGNIAITIENVFSNKKWRIKASQIEYPAGYLEIGKGLVGKNILVYR